jgi:hypothetical protein
MLPDFLSNELIKAMIYKSKPLNCNSFKKRLDRNRCAGLSPSVAPLDHAYQPFSIKLFLKRFLVKLFLKKFAVKPFFKKLVKRLTGL